MSSFKTMRMSGPPRAYKRQKTSHTDHAKLARLQRQVTALRPEVKLYENLQGATQVTTAGNIFPISNIAQGTNAENRIGDIASGVSVEVKITTAGTSALTGIQPWSYSFFLVKDLESNGVVPAISGAQGIFVANTPTGALQQAETSKRFRVLAQRNVPLQQFISGNGSFIYWNVKLGNKMTFHDNTGAQTCCGKNSLYIVMLTDDAGLNAAHAVFNIGSVLRFTDS